MPSIKVIAPGAQERRASRGANDTRPSHLNTIILPKGGRAGQKFPPHNGTLRGHATAYKVRNVEHVQGRQVKENVQASKECLFVKKPLRMLYKEHPQKMLKICLVGGWTRPTLFTQGNKELSLRDVCLIAKGVKQPNRGEQVIIQTR